MRFSPHQPDPEQGEVIASFGEAKLIKKLDRRFELVGGSRADRVEAEKWISLFMQHEVAHGSTHRAKPKP